MSSSTLLPVRALKHLLATGACQVHSEDTYYGHLVLRLMGCLVLFYTSRVICKGRLTMEEIIFSLKHYWRFVDLEVLEFQALSYHWLRVFRRTDASRRGHGVRQVRQTKTVP